MTLDRRLNAVREDLADARLAGTVEAPRYAEGRPARITAPLAACRRRPDATAPLDTEFVFGEPVRVFDHQGDFLWVQSEEDGYVGYVATNAVGRAEGEASHRVSVPLALVFAAPSIKVPLLARLPLGARLLLAPDETIGGERFHALADGGHILAQHVAPIGTASEDVVAVAQQFLGAPYLFGGRSWLGLDCSALIQLACQLAGRPAPRDSDMQEKDLGEEIGSLDALKRGDLVFFKGHVGIMVDGETFLHANGHHMLTATEPLRETLARLKSIGLEPTSIKRLDG